MAKKRKSYRAIPQAPFPETARGTAAGALRSTGYYARMAIDAAKKDWCDRALQALGHAEHYRGVYEGTRWLLSRSGGRRRAYRDRSLNPLGSRTLGSARDWVKRKCLR